MSKKSSKALTTTGASMPRLDAPESMMSFAKELKKVVVAQHLYTEIQKKNYVNVEGWQFAGGSMGLIALVDKCERLERGTEIAYRADVTIYSGEKVVSRSMAICSSKESKKSSFDEYAIASMAQTRAIGKAYRLLLGWMMKAAGYEATPAEEMQNVAHSPEVTPVSKKTDDRPELKKLVAETARRGAKSKRESVEMINAITGAEFPSVYDIDEAAAKRLLAKILMAPEEEKVIQMDKE
jgi:hypothetical protein